MQIEKNTSDKRKMNTPIFLAQVRALFIITVVQIIGIAVLSLNLFFKIFYSYNFLHSKWDNFNFKISGYLFDIPVYEMGFVLFVCMGFAKYGLEPYKIIRNKQYQKDGYNIKRKILSKIEKFMPAWIDIFGFAVIVFSFISWTDFPE